MMLAFFKFCFWYRKSDYSRALACLDRTSVLLKPYVAYSAYRLGLYHLSINAGFLGRDWRSLFASVVSLSALGRRQEANNILSDQKACAVLSGHMLKLANELLAFDPSLAVKYLPKNSPRPLKVAAFMRVGELARVVEYLGDDVILSCTDITSAELHLLRSNAFHPEPRGQLRCLNAFLSCYHVVPLALRQSDRALGASNLAVEGDLSEVRGPLVSVLMTTFRSADRIEPALISLLAQTYRDIEVVIVDDASDDDTTELVAKIALRDARVRLVRLPTNVGTYVAKSIGITFANGDFVTCHDSDDWAHPQKIELQMQPLLADRSIVFTTSNYIRVQDNGIFYARAVYPMLRINPSSVLFRKSLVIEQAGLWDWVRTGADSEFLARLKLVFGKKAMQRIQKPLTIGAHRPDSLMNAATTGYCAQGMSPVRLEYSEAWKHWHIDSLRNGRVPKMETGNVNSRCFVAPESICVSPEAIALCLAFVSS
jgi:glycosyltransferase involved in cell wall biosynthesis